MSAPLPPPLGSRLPPPGQCDSAAIFDRFLDYTSELGLELYPAQEEALLELLAGKNIILATPTGSGKSLVALAMHFKAMAEGRRSFYTSPVKALVNEKFFDLCAAFGPDAVGLMTGDGTVNREASIVCCTAEVLANIALREGEQAWVDYAVLDEFHFYADPERGVAWQVPLLTLPQATFLLMSATLGDMRFFAQALSERNGRPTAVVRSRERPVPLDFRYSEGPLHETVPELLEAGLAPVYVVSFTQRGCHEEAQNLMSVDVCSKEQKRALAEELGGMRCDTPYGRELVRFVRHGIGVHHGGMLPKYRRLVERLAQRGLLRVVSGTDTLGVGVNIPIRTVVLTRLCKFDGEKTKLLSVREFHQICGRAGRKGFDERGSVVVQAPEHAIENLRLEAKARQDPGKRKKLVKHKPPARGYVHWDRSTFERLKGGEPEPLESRFAVSHAMLYNVLGRPEGGCAAMKDLIRRSHDRPALQRRHARLALQMLRSMVRAGIMQLDPRPDGPGTELRVNPDLQPQFSLNYTLSLYAVETLGELDLRAPAYCLDVLSLVEAILEDPEPVLYKQRERLKRELLAELKAAGVEYEQRIEELDKIEHPKPNRDFIYDSFNDFARRHPWVGAHNIRPKGVGREMYEQYADFASYVQGYGLERHEGLLLRYLTDVYKALVQNVPDWARTNDVDDMIAYFHGLVRGVDASLLDEWERLRDPDYVPSPPGAAEPPAPERRRDVTSDVPAFTVAVRNLVFRLVRALAGRDYEQAATLVEPPAGDPVWTAERLAQTLAPYYEEHERIRTDPAARGTGHTLMDQSGRRSWRIRQILVDPGELNDWVVELLVDLERSAERDAPVLVLERIGP